MLVSAGGPYAAVPRLNWVNPRIPAIMWMLRVERIDASLESLGALRAGGALTPHRLASDRRPCWLGMLARMSTTAREPGGESEAMEGT